MNSFQIKNKIILITGAGSGFGKATAEKLASNGAHLVLSDINEETLEQTRERCSNYGVEVLSQVQDVSQEADWKNLISKTASTFGKLDALINNAGYMLTKPYLATTLDEFRRMQQVNVESVWISVQQAYPLLKAAAEQSPGGASVINLSSVFGQVSGFCQSAYSASKGAVRLLTKSQAVEFAREGCGIRVNSVHPGPGNTALAENGARQMVELGIAETPEEAVAIVSQMIPAGRFAEPDDISDLMLFLCSDASRYSTGSEFTLDGGYTAL